MEGSTVPKYITTLSSSVRGDLDRCALEAKNRSSPLGGFDLGLGMTAQLELQLETRSSRISIQLRSGPFLHQ